MEVSDTAFAKGFMRACDDSFNQNWHERSGGNLSYRTKPEKAESAKEELSYDGKQQPVGASAPALPREYFMVSGSGRSMRSMILEPETDCYIIEVDRTGENYRICWGLVKGGRSTSELPTHLMNHEVKMKATEGRYRAIHHTHPANIIAPAFVLPPIDEVFTRELWEMVTECPMVFPAGVDAVGWMAPGGRDIAVAISRLVEEHDVVVWAHHGLYRVGEDFDLTLGLMHTIEKSAEILVKVLSIHLDKLQTIIPQEFRNLAIDFHVDLPEKSLYEKQAESGRSKRQY